MGAQQRAFVDKLVAEDCRVVAVHVACPAVVAVHDLGDVLLVPVLAQRVIVELLVLREALAAAVCPLHVLGCTAVRIPVVPEREHHAQVAQRHLVDRLVQGLQSILVVILWALLYWVFVHVVSLAERPDTYHVRAELVHCLVERVARSPL